MKVWKWLLAFCCGLSLCSCIGSFYMSQKSTRAWVVSKAHTRHVEVRLEQDYVWQPYLELYISDVNHPYWNVMRHEHCDSSDRCFLIEPKVDFYRVRIQLSTVLYSCPVTQATYYRIEEQTWLRIINDNDPCSQLK